MVSLDPFHQRPTAAEFIAARRSGCQPRCTGISSDALARYALGSGPRPAVPGTPTSPSSRSWSGEETGRDFPHDEDDLGACERTYSMAPDELRERMLPVLEEFRRWVRRGINRNGVQVIDREADKAAQRAFAEQRLALLRCRGELSSRHRVVIPAVADLDDEELEVEGDFFMPTVDGVTPDPFPTVDMDRPIDIEGRRIAHVTIRASIEFRLTEWLDGRWDTYLDGTFATHGDAFDQVVEDLHAVIVDRSDAELDLPEGWEEEWTASVELEWRDLSGLAARFATIRQERLDDRAATVVQCEGQLGFFDSELEAGAAV